MPAFSLTPMAPFPAPGGEFPAGIQFQDAGFNIGPPNPAFVNLSGGGVTASYDPITGVLTYTIDGGGSGGGGGAGTNFWVGYPDVGGSIIGAGGVPPIDLGFIGITTEIAAGGTPPGNGMPTTAYYNGGTDQGAVQIENIGYRPRHYMALFDTGTFTVSVPPDVLRSAEETDYTVFALRYQSDPGSEGTVVEAFLPIPPASAQGAGILPAGSNTFTVLDLGGGALAFTVQGSDTNISAAQFIGLYIIQHARSVDRSVAV